MVVLVLLEYFRKDVKVFVYNFMYFFLLMIGCIFLLYLVLILLWIWNLGLEDMLDDFFKIRKRVYYVEGFYVWF